MAYKIFQRIFAVGAILLLLSACRKEIKIDPPINAEIGSEVYKSDITAAGVLTGLYARLSTGTIFGFAGLGSFSVNTGLSADELTLLPGIFDFSYGMPQYYSNSLTSQLNGWTGMYTVIYTANAAIEGISKSESLSENVKKQLLAEAKLVRGCAYFYLANLYGAVPLVLTTDYAANLTVPRSPIETVYQQLIKDLKEAKTDLSENYLTANLALTTVERVRPTKWAASALLARAYLYTKDWANAEAEASSVIGNSVLFSLVSNLDQVFLANSKEAIWQLQPVVPGENTKDGKVFVLSPGGPAGTSKPVYLSSFLLNAFEAGDQRRVKWVNSFTSTANPATTYYYPFKYKIETTGASTLIPTEYLMVLRLSEQYLIRAEARIQQNKILEGIADINAVRARAKGPAGTMPDVSGGLSKDQALKAVLHERQVELFTEWGHRWLDLKRTGTINEVMSVVCPTKGGTWNSNWQLYPIPAADIQKNPNLGPNNPGY